ncbi:hypothetical protein UFOVP647_12 [uncultured Caudovirales phage]|uniref:Uncharacterized protein n=1 Tax=uncultured Caudovirales phage TaxID=2100421 RepID=A0A6J5NC62_9CAUD|nr:hypothetical protein UFOVP647_12 [uncultured Caudovirales phage]
MSFQWIIDNAESISIERKRVVASTTSRSGVVRAVSRGGQAWKFDVKVPDGLRWTDIRPSISAAENLDRVTAANIQIPNSGLEYITKYQGNSANSTGFNASFTKNNTTLTLTSSPTTSSGYKFRAGDFIQLGSGGKVYTVAADVAYNSNTVTLHRPILDATNTVTLLVGNNVTWNVICTQFPTWTIGGYNQVFWNGTFTFSEVLV